MTRVPASTPTSLRAAFADAAEPALSEVAALADAASSVLDARQREARLAELLGAHFRTVWRTLRRLGVPVANVDDAAQEVFIIASKKLELIEAKHERRFLYGVALRVAANARRARVARPETAASELVEHTAGPAPTPEALLDRKRAREMLDRVLEELPDDLRTAFVLFELEGCSGPEVAELLGIPLGTASSRLRRAREAFQELVAELRRGLEPGGNP